MKNRFIVKPVKIVWRSSMIAGNPITRSFQKFGIYDSNWKNDSFYCPNPGGQFLSECNSRKYRVVLDDKDIAKKLASRMNELVNLKFKDKALTNPIKFKINTPSNFKEISSYITESDISNIIIF